jgi:hypothetical protein
MRNQASGRSHTANVQAGHNQDIEEPVEPDVHPMKQQASKPRCLICCCADLTYIETRAQLGGWDGAHHVLGNVLARRVRSTAL